MPRSVDNWNYAAEDAISHLKDRKREFSQARMLELVDDIVMHGSVPQDELIARHGDADFIGTVLGHVTVAVHGPGGVPPGGWYSTTSNPHTYHVHPKFAAEWKSRRRLPQKK